jgi:hypothetical protein
VPNDELFPTTPVEPVAETPPLPPVEVPPTVTVTLLAKSDIW